MTDWYYGREGQRQGPVNEAELAAKLQRGELDSETLVWRQGMEKWMPARNVTELPGSAVPPPLPGKVSSAKMEAQFEKIVDKMNAAGGPPVSTDPEDARQNKIFGIISYLWILCVVPLLFASKSRFARFHANQGLVLLIWQLGYHLAVGVLSMMLGFVGFGGISEIFTIISWGFFVLIILGMVNAAKSECRPLPLIGQWQIIRP